MKIHLTPLTELVFPDSLHYKHRKGLEPLSWAMSKSLHFPKTLIL